MHAHTSVSCLSVENIQETLITGDCLTGGLNWKPHATLLLFCVSTEKASNGPIMRRDSITISGTAASSVVGIVSLRPLVLHPLTVYAELVSCISKS